MRLSIAGIIALGMLLLAGVAPAPAQQQPGFQGAGAALKAMTERSPVEAKDPAGLLRRDLEAFRRKAASMAPEEAAAGWLQLVDRYLQLGPAGMGRQQPFEEPLEFSTLLAALPPPAAWNALATAVEARAAAAPPGPSNTSLLLLAHLLQGKEEELWKDAAALEAQVAAAKAEERPMLSGEVGTVLESLQSRASEPRRVLEMLDLRLHLQRALGSVERVELPDLVTLVGPALAETVLRRALVAPNAEFSVETGDATRKLARKLALELVPKLKTPQWTLAHSLDAASLFEALEKRFPTAKRAAAAREEGDEGPDAESWQEARLYYMLTLVVAKKTQKAAALAPQLALERIPEGAIDDLDRRGQAAPVAEFLRGVLVKNPQLPLWDTYLPLAARAGQAAKATEAVRAALQRPALPAEIQVSLRDHLYKALLGADQADEAADMARAGIEAGAPSERSPEGDERLRWSVALARLGQLLKRNEWLKDGLAAAHEALDAGAEAGDEDQVRELVSLLRELGRAPEAEAVLIQELARSGRQGPPGLGAMAGGPLLVELAGLYSQAGRHADVLLLLDRAPAWLAKDLSEILTQADSQDVPLGQMAAAALAATGRKERALAVAQAVIRAQGGFDPAYELLLELKGQEALPFLEQLAARNRFEERPLIWKAELLRRAGKLEEAEQAARAAIAIDPSDGEQRHGRRLRVYSILAAIREARGDAAQAASYREIVAAIRAAEEADRFAEAGLVQRGVKQYEEALGHFADAYCIQSRLALRLAEEGRFQEAEAHYRRAYELMPESFGRMETHCFGCEGIFAGKRAESLAEEVFRGLLAKSPEKPQLHYLLGFLREQQERYTEALAEFREAVKRDPDYINAWQHIQSVSEHIQVPAADRDAAALTLLRLDPRGEHVQPELEGVSDLRALWVAVEAARKQQPAPGAAVYPLPASKEAVEKLEGVFGEMFSRARAEGMLMERRGRGPTRMHPDTPGMAVTPGQAVAQQQIVTAVGNIVEAEIQMREE